jgi:hypothetical protein
LTGGFAKALCGAIIDPAARDTRIYFFSGDQYVHVQWSAAYNGDSLVANRAAEAISDHWTTIPPGRKFNTIFPDPRNGDFAYLFSGPKFWRINIRTPAVEEGRDIAAFWPSLRKARFI